MEKGLFRRGQSLLLCLGVLTTAACNRETERVAVFPVSGECYFEGQPATGALVILHPDGGQQTADQPAYPHGTVDERGQFTLSTYDEGDGAPPGKYVVVVNWPEMNLGEESGEEEVETTIEGEPVSKDRLGGRYSDPRKSTLLVEVLEKPNTIARIDLK
jgi:hypothetical protein